MKRRITLLELLQMIKDNKQPYEIMYGNEKYKWDFNGYYTICEGRNLRDSVFFKSRSLCGFVKDQAFSYEEPILDEIEKRYLRSVIRPFRDKVVFIQKLGGNLLQYERITIVFRYDDYVSRLNFPAFEKGTMYQGMEVEKRYTLEELDLC